MEFNTLKLFKTQFRFNKIESQKYFDKVLLSGCGIYMDEFEKETTEHVHVVSSWSLICKYLSYALLLLTVLFMLSNIGLLSTGIIFGVSLILKFINWILDKIVEMIIGQYEMTKMFLTADCYKLLEDTRQDLIKERELNKI